MSEVKHIFSIPKFIEDGKKVGYPASAILKDVERWCIHQGKQVKLSQDNRTGHIVGTELLVNKDWCEVIKIEQNISKTK
jgi:hypothetical protein